MTFPSYPEYKEAGVEWLGDVPVHWYSAPIKYMALERNSLFLDGDWIESKDISSEGIRYITTGNVGEGAYKEQGAGFISEVTFHSLGCTDVCEGDVLISRLNNPIGRACITPDLGGRVVTSVDNVIFRPDSKYHKKFIVYLFSSEEYFKHTGNLARGATMQRISRGLLGNIRVVIPSLEEQTQIARFLDHETARIDALIEEQQRLIELLKEKRQAVISQAVTKGLEPRVSMKDSGIDWLGEVPAHWGVKALRYLGECQNGINIGGEAFGSGSPFVSYGDVYKNDVLPAEVTGLVQSSPEDQQRYSIEYGDVFFTRTSETVDEIGFSATCLQDLPSAVFAGFLIRFRPTGKSLTPGFSKYYFRNQGLRIFFNKEMNLVTRASLSQDLLKLLPVTIPPVVEQIKISDFLDKVTAEFASLLQQGIKAIDLLKERRSALISAAVTGKIDVRSWQLPTSSQAPELAVAEAV